MRWVFVRKKRLSEAVMMERSQRINALQHALSERILLLDGAMGTMIQSFGLGESDFRGDRFANWEKDLKGNNDLLSITQPRIIQDIHRQFLDAGADIIETNTFNATSISQRDYQLQDQANSINISSAKIARKTIDQYKEKNPNG